MNRLKNIFSVTFLLTILVLLTIPEICSLKYASIYAQTIDQCSQQLDRAEEEYQFGVWYESIELIKQCLAKPNLSEIEKGRAYRILSLDYMAMGLEKNVKNAIKNLLTMLPHYKFQKGKDPALLQIYIDEISPRLIPEIDFILPESREQNAEGFTMSVKGSNFTYGSQVMIRGKGKTTIFISDSILLAEIPASDMLTDDEYEITVYSPILGGRISNPEKFEVKSPSFSFWEWIGLGTAVAVLVAAAIYLLKPYPDPIPIADPPGRP